MSTYRSCIIHVVYVLYQSTQQHQSLFSWGVNNHKEPWQNQITVSHRHVKYWVEGYSNHTEFPYLTLSISEGSLLSHPPLGPNCAKMVGSWVFIPGAQDARAHVLIWCTRRRGGGSLAGTLLPALPPPQVNGSLTCISSGSFHKPNRAKSPVRRNCLLGGETKFMNPPQGRNWWPSPPTSHPHISDYWHPCCIILEFHTNIILGKFEMQFRCLHEMYLCEGR